MKTTNIFKLSRKQIIILVILALTGAIIGYDLGKPEYILCIDGPCNSIKSKFSVYSYLYGFFIFGIISYILEVIYNFFKRK